MHTGTSSGGDLAEENAVLREQLEVARDEAAKQRRIARQHERRKIAALKAVSRVADVLDRALDEIEQIENTSTQGGTTDDHNDDD